MQDRFRAAPSLWCRCQLPKWNGSERETAAKEKRQHERSMLSACARLCGSGRAEQGTGHATTLQCSALPNQRGPAFDPGSGRKRSHRPLRHPGHSKSGYTSSHRPPGWHAGAHVGLWFPGGDAPACPRPPPRRPSPPPGVRPPGLCRVSTVESGLVGDGDWRLATLESHPAGRSVTSARDQERQKVGRGRGRRGRGQEGRRRRGR